jgi:hypothetical protein
MVSAEPAHFFAPPISASGVFSGWLGVYLDSPPLDATGWDEIAAIIEDAYRQVAPKTLITAWDNRSR